MRYFHSSQSVNTSRIRILALRQIQKSIRCVRSVGNIQNGATLTRRDGEETKGSPPFNEHLWCDFKCSPWAKNSSPNTNDLYIHYMDKSTGTPSLEQKKALPNCANKDGNIIHVLIFLFPPLLQQFWSVWNDWTHMYKSLVFGDEFLAHLKSHQRCSAAFCRPVKFFHTDWIIISLWFLSYTQRHCHVRIEKGSVQTVAIQLDSLEYHYMLKY